MSWALKETNDGDTAVVLITTILVNSSSFLNLNTKSGIYTLKEHMKKIRKDNHVDIDPNVPDFKNKYRCFIMDLLPNTIKVIQKNFKLKSQPKVVSQSPDMGKMDIELQSGQICVRDTSTIQKDSIRVVQRKTKTKIRINKHPKKKVNYNIKY